MDNLFPDSSWTVAEIVKEKEIADKLDISINTVSSMKNRAIKKMRKSIW